MCYILSIQILFSPAALFILLPGTAGAGIIGIDLGLHTLNGSLLERIVLVGAGNFGYLLPLYFLFDAYMEQQTDGLLPDVLGHIVEHLITVHFIFYQRVFLGICL